MNESMHFGGRQAARTGRAGLAFSAGLLVGLAGAIAGLAIAVALERRQRRRAARGSEAAPAGPAADWQTQDHELDEELAQTFPASDPLPHSHRVD